LGILEKLKLDDYKLINSNGPHLLCTIVRKKDNIVIHTIPRYHLWMYFDEYDKKGNKKER